MLEKWQYCYGDSDFEPILEHETPRPTVGLSLTRDIGVPMEPLIQIIYASTSSRELTGRELSDLLFDARRHNEQLDVTGMLVHVHGTFFQVIEGPTRIIDELYSRVAQDCRHVRPTCIVREPIPRRAFGDWTMAFSNMTPLQITDLAGIDGFFGKAACFEKLDGVRAKKLLAAFRGGRWRARRSTVAQLSPVGSSYALIDD